MLEKTTISSDRIGTVIAAVLLTFAFTRVVQSPRLTLSVELPGFYFSYPITIGTALSLLAAALTAAGMDWIARERPAANKSYMLLPTLSAFIIGSALNSFSAESAWISAFALGAFVLGAVITAEYAGMDPATPAYAISRAGLTALAYALFLILAASLRFNGARMFLLAPVIFVFAGLISLRILQLDGVDRWDFPWSAGIGIICMQMAAGLHYWPITPIQFGLAVTGALYALTSFSIRLNNENIPLPGAAITPALMLLLSWAAAFLIR